MAALLSLLVCSVTVCVAVVLVIVPNAGFAFMQELQAEKAVEALARYMPQRVTRLHDGAPTVIDTAELVPGDVSLVEEGERIAAHMRLISARWRSNCRPSPASRCPHCARPAITTATARAWQRATCAPGDLPILLAFPLIVWGADELRRYLIRRRASTARGAEHTSPELVTRAP